MSKISLNESTGAIFAGGSGDDGDLILKDAGGRSRIHLDGGDGSDPFKEISFDGQPIAQAGRRAYVDGKNAELKLGSNGRNGKIKLESTSGEDRFTINANGELRFRDGNKTRFLLDAGEGTLSLNGPDGEERIHFETGGETSPQSKTARLLVGGEGANGEIVLLDRHGTESLVLAVGDQPQGYPPHPKGFMTVKLYDPDGSGNRLELQMMKLKLGDMSVYSTIRSLEAKVASLEEKIADLTP